jgi:DeoR family glycerol-3-phosphate regulon repressor
MVRQRGSVSVETLAGAFEISPETIRRDLAVLARQGKVQKVHGGAALPRAVAEGPFAQRMRHQVAAKRKMAGLARKLVAPGQTLLVDTGSTTLVFAEELVAVEDLTVITNSAEVARVLADGNASHQVYLVGGAYRGDNRQTCGAMAVSQLSCFHAETAFLTVGAVDAVAGATDYNSEEAEMARAMIRRAQSVVLLADASKFDRAATFTVSAWDAVRHLVCDSAPGTHLMSALERENVQVIC